MEVGTRSGGIPPTTSKALGTLLWVLGGLGDLSQVIAWSHLKVALPDSWGFWGLGKSSKVMKKSKGDDSFFGFEVSKGIKRVTPEKKSRDLVAISARARAISARSGDW